MTVKQWVLKTSLLAKNSIS